MLCKSFRFFILFICLISACVTFITRTCMNIALVSMVKDVKLNASVDSSSSSDGLIKYYTWSESDQGLILSAFYWSYIIFQMPMGSLAEKAGGKAVICICLAGSTLVNLITPFVADYLFAVITLRFILGAVQAGMFPAAFSLQVNWMPMSDRSLGFACMDAGASIGSIIAFFTSGFLIQSYSWPCLFYVSGSLSLLVLLVFVAFVKSNPEEHSLVSEEELNIIKGCEHFSDSDQSNDKSHTKHEKIDLNGKRGKTHKTPSIPCVIVTPVSESGELSEDENHDETCNVSPCVDKGERNNYSSHESPEPGKGNRNECYSETPKLLASSDTAAVSGENESNCNIFSLNRRKSLAISVSGENVPWIRIFTNVPVLATGFFKFTVAWNYMIFYTKMPSFLKEITNVDITSNGIINALNNISIAISLMMFGYLSEKIIQYQWLTRTKCRKFFAIFSGFCQAIAIASIPHMAANCNLTLFILLLLVASFCNGCQSGSDIPLPSEMTKAFPATLYALLNIIATSTGIIVPPAVAFILNMYSDDRFGGWSIVFYMSSLLTIVSTITFILFSSAERQPFDFHPGKSDCISNPPRDNHLSVPY